MTRFIKLSALAALVVLVGACCPCRKHRTTENKPLVATQWQLAQLNGSVVPVQDDLFTITFGEDGRLSGLGVCNRLMGQYEVDQTGGLKIGPMASTRMACPGMERESVFAEVLSGTTHYDIDGQMLMLLTDGEVKAVFQAK